MSAGLELDVRCRRGPLALDVTLHAGPGEVVAVVGPNGAGKSTLLGVVAGLVPPDDGHVRVGGRTLVDTAAGVALPPRERGLGVVFQDHLLFPRMSALENVAFGPRSRGATGRDARTTAAAWLERVGLAEVGPQLPGTLSGGQSQRVALARALAAEPEVLLLDEPMAALDVEARRAVRRVLRTHLAAFAGPALLVAHEPLEAITLADRLVVLEDGRVVQDAAPGEVARRPRSPWAARLVGLNLYRGTAHGTAVALDDGGELVLADRVAGEDGQDGAQVLVVAHPRAVALHRERPAGSPRNCWRGRVDSLDLHDEHVRVHVAGEVPVVAEITPGALAELRLEEGATVWAAVKATELDAYPA